MSSTLASCTVACRTASETPLDDDSDALVELARNAGMMVMLDAQIGRETYHSVTGSLVALRRFAASLKASQREAAAA
jgi:hypothetical protein